LPHGGRRWGASALALAEHLPHLGGRQIEAALGYYRLCPREIDDATFALAAARELGVLMRRRFAPPHQPAEV